MAFTYAVAGWESAMRHGSVQVVIAQIDRSGECWQWPGQWRPNGQPAVRVSGRVHLVNRLAYQALVAPLESGQKLRKACQTPGCVRPGPGHWDLPRSARTAGSVRPAQPKTPRGITYLGVDKDGQEVWRLSVYLGRDIAGGNRRVEHRERVHGPLQAAIDRREALLAETAAERRRVAAGVRGKTMADLLDAYLPVWRRTPRKGHPPAPKTVYQRDLLVANVIKPAIGQRVPSTLTSGELASWYDALMENGYTTTRTVTTPVLRGACRRCGHQARTLAQGGRVTAQVACPACPGVEVRCRRTGEATVRQVAEAHKPVNASTMGDIHAILTGAFRFGVQRGWLSLSENPMPLVQRPSRRQPVKQRPPSPEEVQRALAAARAHAEPNLYPLLAFLADTGARLGEACALRLSDVHGEGAATLEESVSEVPKRYGGRQIKDTKTHNKRTIAIHPATLAALHQHLNRCRRLAAANGQEWPTDPFLFPVFQGSARRINPAVACSSSDMSRRISALFASLGIPASAKGLRSFVVTNWRKARVPDDVLRGRLGHEAGTPVTDRHYHYREAATDRQETDALVGELLYATATHPAQSAHPSQVPSGNSGNVISLAARRERRRPPK
jgi:integrase